MGSLSEEQNKKLLIEWQENQNKTACDMLFMCNLPVVYLLAQDFIGLGTLLQDIISAGDIALIEGINTFDYKNSDVTFNKFIREKIGEAMKNEVKKYGRENWQSSLSQILGTKIDNLTILDNEKLNLK